MGPFLNSDVSSDHKCELRANARAPARALARHRAREIIRSQILRTDSKMSAENNAFDNQPKQDGDVAEDELAKKIVTYYGYFGEHSLKRIAKTCAKLIISEHCRELCFDDFEFPSHGEIKSWVLEEMKQNFEEKVMPIIEQTYPRLSEAELDEEISRLEKKYEKEHKEQLESTTRAAIKELQIRVRGLQKEFKELKRKYTI